MIDSYFRTPYQKNVINPILKNERFENVSPVWITGLAMVFGILVMPFLYLHLSLFAFLSLLLSGFLDTLDGSIARKYQKTSSVGAVFDIFSDRLCEFCILMGLFLYDPERAIACFLMLGSVLLCITSFLVVGIFSKNESEKSFYYSPGIMERAEAFILFGLMILIPNFFYVFAYTFTGLVFMTSFIRLYQFMHYAQEN